MTAESAENKANGPGHDDGHDVTALPLWFKPDLKSTHFGFPHIFTGQFTTLLLPAAISCSLFSNILDLKTPSHGFVINELSNRLGHWPCWGLAFCR